tara:strand:- start:333 stop:1340 length:1008 start_codon:yes stop_codon:yes gene_type:complete
MINIKKTLIVAEACDNHFGSLTNAKKMVDEAKKNGADVIKFQHHLPDEEMLKNVPQSKNFKISLYKFLKKYALKLSDHEELMRYCKKKNILYLCTPFSFKAAEELIKIGVQWFKIGSGEFLDIFFIEKIMKFKKNIIFSTGMCEEKEMNYMYKKLLSLKSKKQKVSFMNCTSEYPPNSKDLNIGYISNMIKKFPKFTIGHSDHTNDIYTSIAAVALGAKIIEKHVHLDGLNHGPDKDVSISFKKLGEMSSAIRQLEVALGNKKKIHQDEKIIRAWAHRSVVVTKDLAKGSIIKYHDIVTKRPGIGIPSLLYKKVLGKKLKKNLKKNTLVKWEDLN